MSINLHRFSKAAICYSPFLVFCGVIFIFSCLHKPAILYWFHFPFYDKILHLIAFSILGAAAAFGAARRKGELSIAACLEAWIIVCFYGFLDEIHQIFVPMRHAHLADWVFDILGGALGTLLFFLVSKYIKKR